MTEERFQHLGERWFLSEPALFSIYCIHNLTPNPSMRCPVRVGKGLLEYNSLRLDSLSDEALEEIVRIEMIRVLLKHPYERRPVERLQPYMYMASDMVVASHYKVRHTPLSRPSQCGLPEKRHYEWYLHHIPIEPTLGGGATAPQPSNEAPSPAKDHSPQSGNKSDDDNKTLGNEAPSHNEPQLSPEERLDAAALWEEDEARKIEVNEIINRTEHWGTVPGKLVNEIIASTKARIDYRKVLAGFRSSVLSSRRCLTRMRPNRRKGFEQMGSRYDLASNLLVAVDVSASVSDKELAHFYSVIGKFFKYGIERIDVIQFDAKVQGECVALKQAARKVAVKGRGGTCFQPVIDYARTHKGYDGLIILTDGYAPPPTLPPHFPTRLLWVCTNEKSFLEHNKWMRSLGRVCHIST
ncbi:MAG: hypothetical protein HUK17_03940 [Bacteroidales bacterium]|nr:hypothetical protein [Bacteroidales bacterium]